MSRVGAASFLALSGPARARLAQGSKEKTAREAQIIEVTARNISSLELRFMSKREARCG